MKFLSYMKDTSLLVVHTFTNVPQDVNFMKIFKSPDGILAMLLLAVGLFYCLAGMIFRKISIGSFLSVLIFKLLKEYHENVDSVAEPINDFFLRFFTENLENSLPQTIKDLLNNNQYFIGYLLLSLIIAVILSFFLPIGKFFTLVAFFYYLQEPLAEIFAKEIEKLPCTHILVALALTIMAYLVIEKIEYTALIVIFSFIGSVIVLLGLSKIFSYPKDFDSFILNIHQNIFDTIKSVNFIYLLLLSSFFICIQHSFNKNK